MNQYHRVVTSHEQKFSDECDTGNGKICFTMLYIVTMFELQCLLWLCSPCVMLCWLVGLENSNEKKKSYLWQSNWWRSRSMQQRCWRTMLDGKYWKQESILQVIIWNWKVSTIIFIVCCSLVQFPLYRYAQIWQWMPGALGENYTNDTYCYSTFWHVALHQVLYEKVGGT